MHLPICLLLILSCFADAQNPDISGKWYFDRLGGPHGEIANDPQILKANKQNEGLSLTFAKDNKMISSQQVGTKVNNSTVDYKVSYDRKQVIIGGDTLRIMLLTSDILELYPINERRPALFLKRSKDGKTAMSAPK
jgi:hypothetical protein